MIKKNYLLILVVIIFVLIYRNILLPSNLSSGDFVYYFPQTIKEILPFAAWDARHGGLGASVFPRLWIEGYFTSTVKLAQFMPWYIYERLFWFWPILIFLFLSPYLLAKKIFKENYYSIFASLIYSTNTYILLILGGGQVGVALSYAIAPLVVLFCLKLFFYREISLRNSVIFGLLFAVLAMFDLRIAYVSGLGIVLVVLFSFFIVYKHNVKKFLKDAPYLLLVPGAISLFYHAYWILPILISRSNPIAQIGSDYTSVSSAIFFSFAKMENSFSLLHPNWPDNVFGKIYFLRPYFLLLPLISYSSLLFLKNKTKETRIIVLFVLIGLLGVFLAKGATDPFGNIYILLFEKFPGFQMFRDPTKWYILISLSYSILIPFALFNIASYFKGKKYIKPLVFIFFVVFWMFLIREFVNKNAGTFKNHMIAYDYNVFAANLTKDNTFYRTLWVLSVQRYGFSSQTHPAIGLSEVNSKNIPIGEFFREANAQNFLRQTGVRYVVVPIDSEKEIFLTDRIYDNKIRNNDIQILNAVPYLKRIEGYQDLAIYEIKNSLPHFYTDKEIGVTPFYRSPTEYKLNINNMSGEKLIFSDTYDPNWVLISNGKQIGSIKFNNFNSFNIQNIHGFIEIVYSPQKYVWVGLIVSLLTIAGSILILIKKR